MVPKKKKNYVAVVGEEGVRTYSRTPFLEWVWVKHLVLECLNQPTLDSMVFYYLHQPIQVG